MNLDKTLQGLEINLGSAVKWLEQSSNSLISENYRLIREFQKSQVKIKRLNEASKKRMSVGVYGASQSGKSYFVSALAKGDLGRVTTEVETKKIDFLQKINPAGGKESTAIVTRFTTNNFKHPENFPINVRLLSRFDIVSIIANSFYNDVEYEATDDFDSLKEKIQKNIDTLGSFETDTEKFNENFFILEEYCESRFSSSIYYQALRQTNFWLVAPSIYKLLNYSEVCRLFEILWDSVPVLTQTLQFLLEELDNLENAKTIYCSPEALFETSGGEWKRKAESIINVQSLGNLNRPNDEKISIKTETEKLITVGLATIAALAAEVTFYLPGTPSEFFKSSDLLDFPGARSRHKQNLSSLLKEQLSLHIDNFLRGKITYLFEQYTSNFEVSALLLCVGPSNQEVVGLDKLVEDWVMATLGARPETRALHPNTLFLILTKFDLEFSRDLGKDIDASRWEARAKASIEEPFGNKHSHRTNWLKAWNNSENFKNAYWWRSPDADQAGLINYSTSSAERHEESFRSDKVEFIGQLRQAFITSDAANKYFRNPIECWDAAMELNDGGAALVLRKLAMVCKDENRRSQIEQQYKTIVRDRISDLRKFYISENNEEISESKKSLAKKFLGYGYDAVQYDRLGELIFLLTVRDDRTRTIYVNTLNEMERRRNAKRKRELTDTLVSKKIDNRLASLLGLEEQAEPQIELKENFSKTSEFSRQLLLNFIEDWSRNIKSIISQEGAADYYYIDKELLIEVLNEFEIAIKLSGLHNQLAILIDENYQYKTSRHHWVWKQSAMLTAKFNAFISSGGIISDGETTIEAFNGKKIVVFAQKDFTGGDIVLQENGLNFSEQYFIDWLNSVQFMIRKNISSSFKSEIAILENNQLWKLLSELEAINTEQV